MKQDTRYDRLGYVSNIEHCKQNGATHMIWRFHENHHSLLIRIFWALVVVLVAGFLLAGTVISYATAQSYVLAQSNYEYEKMSGDADKLNEKLVNISSALTQTYQMDEDRESISTLLKDGPADLKEQSIQEFALQTIQSSPYISDILILDIQEKEVYFYSDILSQRRDLSYDWFGDAFVRQVENSSNGVLFQKDHAMPGINTKRNVCTFGHKIIDLTSGNPKDMVGVILVEVPTEELFEPLEDDASAEQEGQTFVIDEGYELLYSVEPVSDKNSAAEIYYQYTQGGENLLDRYLIRSKKLVSWSGFTYVNIMDKSAVFSNNFRQILLSILPILLASVLACFIAIRIAIFLIRKRIGGIVQYTRKVRDGQLSEKIEIEKNDEFAIIERGLNIMTDRLEQYINEKYIADIALKKGQIRSLQLQMNPHFMFNTLENIRASVAAGGDMKSAEMVSILGNMYRWNLRKPDVVTVEEELDYLAYYVELQENRYEGRLQYTEDIPKDVLDYSIPKLTLQPIIENCLNHGFLPSMKLCKISLVIRKVQEFIDIEISDNGIGMPEATVEELRASLENESESNTPWHIGMKNIHQRIQLMFGREYGIKIYSRENEGTRITVRFPARIMKEEEQGHVSDTGC